MTKNTKIFSIAIIISFFGWWGLNLVYTGLTDVFYWQEIGQNSDIFLAQINVQPRMERILNQYDLQQELELELKAESAISIFVNPRGEEEIIFEKNASVRRPIASLTKLMTALIAEKEYQSDQIFVISQTAVDQEEDKGNLKIGENLSLNELLHIVLIESSNDAAWAIGEGKDNFSEEMNTEAQRLGMKNTYFVNPTGLDGFENYSTAVDLVELVKYISNQYPQIFKITQKQSYEVLNPDGSLHHFIGENTNKLLAEVPGIIGGKTGYTDEAGGCIVLLLENEKGGYFINVILGTVSADERFPEMKKLIDFDKEYESSI